MERTAWPRQLTVPLTVTVAPADAGDMLIAPAPRATTRLAVTTARRRRRSLRLRVVMIDAVMEGPFCLVAAKKEEGSEKYVGNGVSTPLPLRWLDPAPDPHVDVDLAGGCAGVALPVVGCAATRDPGAVTPPNFRHSRRDLR
jgi:hypothetical protein